MNLEDAPVLVTGGSGFVGSAVARALQAHGARLRLLVRPESPRTNIQSLAAEVVVGDIRNPGDMDRALNGCRFLFHVAADYRLWARDPEEIVRNNLQGTTRVMEAALAAGVERIVYTSSVATLRLTGTAAPADESGPLSEAEGIGAYKRSKVAAERIVERMVVDRGLPAVIVNPSTPIGPRDVRPTPTGRIIVEAAAGRMPAFVDTGLNLVHVDDVAEGHVRALERGRIGERYILGGQDASLGEMLTAIARLTQRRPPKLRLPIAPLRPLAEVAELFGRLSGREPFLTKDGLKMAQQHMYFTSARAEAELGYSARPYESALAEAISWFRQAEYLR
jgi:dihydroflavonol-4-reductase